jgi:hypothetical protein
MMVVVQPRVLMWLVAVPAVFILMSCTTAVPGSIDGLLAGCGGPSPGGVYPTSGTVWLTGDGFYRSFHTQADGRFVFDNLSPGRYTVYAGRVSGLYPRQSATVRAGATSTVTVCFPIR